MDLSVSSWTPEEVLDEVLGVSRSLEARKMLLSVSKDWNRKLTQWRTTPIASLCLSDLHKEVNVFINKVDYLEKGLMLST